MRILIISSEYGPYVRGGLGSHVNQLVAHLATAGVRLTVGLATHECVALIDYEQGQPVWRAREQPDVSALDWHDGQMVVNSALVALLTRCYPELPFDAIHSHDWISWTAGRELAEQAGQPHLVTVHVLQDMLLRTGYTPDPRACAIEREMCTLADHVVTVSEAMRQRILLFPGVAPDRVSVIYNWVDPELFRDVPEDLVGALRRRLAPAGEQIVLYAGRLSLQKGVEYLLATAEQVRAARPRTRWVVVGRMSPHAAQRLQPFLMPGNDHILFEGVQPRAELACYYRAADCVVEPSVYEPFGMVAIEAMAAGTPVIVSDIDGLREIVTDESGIRVAFEEHRVPARPDSVALASAQIRLLADDQLRSRLGSAGQQRVQTHFSTTALIPYVLELYTRHTAAAAPHAASNGVRAEQG
ncbi:MAG TPA: glycosyltransferase family 4 protein [Roseiflexaceae bacterium]|nr:glycosyltransferase family 4 protein [Roseiflexaceae bacterium]